MPTPVVTTTFERYLVDFQSTYSDYDGTSTLVETFRIKKRTNPAGPIIAPGGILIVDGDDWQLMIAEGVIPVIGEQRINWTGSPPTYPFCSFPVSLMRLRSHDFSVSKTGDITCVLTWSTLYTLKPSTVNATPPAVPVWDLPASIEYMASTRAMAAWRRNWSVNPPVGSDATTVDISGAAFSDGTKGAILQVPQVRIRLRIVNDATLSGADMKNQFSQIDDYVGTINSDVFLDFPVGTVVCDSVTMGRVQHEFYEIIMEYTYDKFAHHSQIPKLDPDGNIELDNLGRAKTVYWERETRTSAPFNNIWNGNTDLQTLAETGYSI